MILALLLNATPVLARRATLSDAQAGPRPVAPFGLTVAIAEASLTFGDTATAIVSVDGDPAPTLTYQWALDGVDVEGKTGPAYEGVPVGALQVRVAATKSEGTAGPVTSDPVTVLPALTAPAIAARGGLSGRTLTVTVDSVAGYPAPDVSVAMALDGAPVAPTGSGPWAYTAPDAASASTIAWAATATNGAGSASASGSEIVAANLFAPVAAGGLAGLTLTLGAAMTPVDAAADFTGAAPITYALAPSSAALPDGLALSGDGVLSGTPTALVADASVVVRGSNAHGFADSGFSLSVFAALTAPSNLTISIAEASLAFGDTATAVVTVDGDPTPDVTYQWTLDGVDVDGQTNPTFDGVPVGALRVRVSATNSEGAAGPVTSDPVTVVALAPDAFSVGQWTADATGDSGAVAITLFGLPPANGAAITSVERAAGTLRKSWASTTASQDWSGAQQIAPFMVNNSPWNLAAKAGSTWDVHALYGGVNGAKVVSITSDLPLGDGGVAGAPFIALGKHYNEATTVNPFTQDALIGLRSDGVTEFTSTATWADRSTDPDRSQLVAWQVYGSLARTQSDDWNNAGASFFDIQVRPSPTAGINFPAMTGTNSYTATIGGVEFDVVRSITTWQGANTRSYGFQPTSATLTEAPLKAVIDWIVANETANFAQADAWIWLYGVQAWVEPRAGVTDVAITDFAVVLNGVAYDSAPAWTALAGMALDTAYTVSGLLDGEITDFALRAVNGIGAGPESDTKTETPFALAAPETVGDNGWTFQPVASSTDLEVFIAQTPDWTGFSLNVDAEGADVATYTALDAGPVALAAPIITGTPALGATMTAGAGRWVSLSGVTSYAYQWERDGVAIGGATAATHDLVASDENTDLTVVVTATDAQGATASESAATATGAFTPALFPVAYTGLRNAAAFELGDAAWTNNGNISASALTADGPYLSPRRITLTSGTDAFRGRFASVGSPTSGTPYLVAAIVKSATGGRATLRVETSGGSLLAEVFTTTFSSVSGSSGPVASAAVTDVGGGYVRLSYTYTPASTQATNIKIGPAGGATNNAVDAYGAGMAEAV